MDIKLAQFRNLFNTGANGAKSTTSVSSTKGEIQVNVGENGAVTLSNVRRKFSERHFSAAQENTNTERQNSELRNAFLNALKKEGASAKFLAKVTDMVVKDPSKPLTRRLVRDVLNQFDKFLEDDSYEDIIRGSKQRFAEKGDVEKTGMRSGPMAAFVARANDAASDNVVNGASARIYFGFKKNDPQAHFATELEAAHSAWNLHKDVNQGVLAKFTGFALQKIDRDVGKWIGHKIESGLGFRGIARPFCGDEVHQNNNARHLFLRAVFAELEARGLKGVTLDNLPKSIKDALCLDDYGEKVTMNKNGTFKFERPLGRPLTARRIHAVRDAINNLFAITQKSTAGDKAAVVIGVLTGRIAPSVTTAFFDRSMRGGVKRVLAVLREHQVKSAVVPEGQPRPSIPKVRFGLTYVKFEEKVDSKGKTHLMATVGGITTEIEGGVEKLIANFEKDIRNHTEFYSVGRLTAERNRIEAKPLAESRAERLEFYLSVIRSRLGETTYKSLNLAPLSLANLKIIADNALSGSYDKPEQKTALANFVNGFDPNKLQIASANAVEVVNQMEEAIANRQPTNVVMPQREALPFNADRVERESRQAMHDLIADFIEPNDVVAQNRELAAPADPGIKFVDTLLTHFDGFKALLKADNGNLRRAFGFTGDGLPDEAKTALADKVIAALSTIRGGRFAQLAALPDNLLRTSLEYLSVVMHSGVESPAAQMMLEGIRTSLDIDRTRAERDAKLVEARARVADLEARYNAADGVMAKLGLSAQLTIAKGAVAALEKNFNLLVFDLLSDAEAVNEVKAQIVESANGLRAELNNGLDQVMNQVSPKMASMVKELFNIPYDEMVELLRMPNDTPAQLQERARRMLGERPQNEPHENGANGANGAQAPAEKPEWQRTLKDMNGGEALSYRSGEGRFMIKAMLLYLESIPANDRRHMVASLVRYTEGNDSAGKVIGAMLKGAGPIMQKMLQGIPINDSIPADLRVALEDMRDNLAPIPNNIVEAQLFNLVKESNGKIKSIQLNNTMGAASVGQSFLATIVKADDSTEQVVVKMLRPDVQNRANREKDFFRQIAETVPGMKHTFEGRLATILDELDLTIEATNIEKGVVYHENPDFNVKSVKVSSLVRPKTDVLVMERAPGDTIQTRMKKIRERLAELRSPAYQSQTTDGAPCFRAHTTEEYLKIRKEIADYSREISNHNRLLTSLAMEWITEAIFHGGFFHGDMHAGNIMSDGRTLTLIDFGNATKLSAEEQANLIKIVVSTTAQRADRFLEGFRGLLSDDGKRVFDQRVQALKPTVDKILKMGHSSDAAQRIMAIMNLMQQNGIEVPAQISKFVQSMMRLTEAIGQTEALDREIDSFLQNFMVDDDREIREEGGVRARQDPPRRPIDLMNPARSIRLHLSDNGSNEAIRTDINIANSHRDEVTNEFRRLASPNAPTVREHSAIGFAHDVMDYVAGRDPHIVIKEGEAPRNLTDELRAIHEELSRAYDAAKARLVAAGVLGAEEDLNIRLSAINESVNVKELQLQHCQSRIAAGNPEPDDAANIERLQAEIPGLRALLETFRREAVLLENIFIRFAEKATEIYSIDLDNYIASLKAASNADVSETVGFDTVFSGTAISNVKAGLSKLGFFTAIGLQRSMDHATEAENEADNAREEVMEDVVFNREGWYSEVKVANYLTPEVRTAIKKSALNFATPPNFGEIVRDRNWANNPQSVETVFKVLAHNAKILKENLTEGNIPFERFLEWRSQQRTSWAQLLLMLVDASTVKGLAKCLGAEPHLANNEELAEDERAFFDRAKRAELMAQIDRLEGLADNPEEELAIKNIMKDFLRATEKYYIDGDRNPGGIFEEDMGIIGINDVEVEVRPVVLPVNLHRDIVENEPVAEPQVNQQQVPQPVVEPQVNQQQVPQPVAEPVAVPVAELVPVAPVQPAPAENRDNFDIAYYRRHLVSMENKFTVVRNYATRQEFANLQAHIERAKFVLDLIERDLDNVVVVNTHKEIKSAYVVRMLKPADYDTDDELKSESVDVGGGIIEVKYTAHRAGLVLQRLTRAPNHYAEYNTLAPLPGTDEIPDDTLARTHFLSYAGGILKRYVMSVVDPFFDTFGTEKFKKALGVYNAPINGKCIELNTNAIEGERTERGLMRIGGANGEKVEMDFADTTENDELLECLALESVFIVRNGEASGEDWSELAPIFAKRCVGLTRMVNGVPTKVTVADIEDCRNKFMAKMIMSDVIEEDFDNEVQLDTAQYTAKVERALAEAKRLQAEARANAEKDDDAEDELEDGNPNRIVDEQAVETVADGAVEKLENAKKALAFLAELKNQIVPNPGAKDDPTQPTFLKVAKVKKAIDWSKPRKGVYDIKKEGYAGMALTYSSFRSMMEKCGIKINSDQIRYRETSPYFAGQCLRYAENVIKNYVRTITDTFLDAFGTEKQNFMIEVMNLEYLNADVAVEALERVHTGPAFLEKRIFEAAFGARPNAMEIELHPEILDELVPEFETGKVEKTTDSFEFKGIVFRSDSRSFNVVRDHGTASPQKVDGFSSQKDLSDEANLLEAKGIGEALGATGQSGVSCSRQLNKCIGYATAPMGNSFSYVYVIDTTRLGEGEHAWDMDSVYDAGGGKNPEKTGKEVNASAIRKEAVMGWIKVPREVADFDGADADNAKVTLLKRYCLEHPGAIEANPDYVA